MYAQNLPDETIYKYKIIGTTWHMDPVSISTFHEHRLVRQFSGFLQHYLLAFSWLTDSTDFLDVCLEHCATLCQP